MSLAATGARHGAVEDTAAPDPLRRLLVRRYHARHPAHRGSFLHPHH